MKIQEKIQLKIHEKTPLNKLHLSLNIIIKGHVNLCPKGTR